MVKSRYGTVEEDVLDRTVSFFSSGWVKAGLALLVIFLFASMTGCMGTQVRSGQVGVRVVDMAIPGITHAGVQERELGVGWHPPIPGTYVLKMPTTQRTEVWANSDQRSADRADNVTYIGNSLSFNNGDGVPTSVAISVQVSMSPDLASEAVQRYRMGFDDIIRGPVQRELQDTLIRVGPHFTSAQLLADGGASLAAEVTEIMRDRLAEDGVILTSINLVGAPTLPTEIRARINARIEAEQNAATQEQQVRVVEAQARQRIAEAEGQARATQIEGEALRANPQVLRLREIDKWDGRCPLDANICGASGVITDSRR